MEARPQCGPFSDDICGIEAPVLVVRATPPKVAAPVPLPTPIADGPLEDQAAVELRKLRQEIRRQAQRADVARQNAENDRRQDAACRALDRLHEGLDRDTEAPEGEPRCRGQHHWADHGVRPQRDAPLLHWAVGRCGVPREL